MIFSIVGGSSPVCALPTTSEDTIIQLEDDEEGTFETEEDAQEGCECVCHEEEDDVLCEDEDCRCNCHDDEDNE